MTVFTKKLADEDLVTSSEPKTVGALDKKIENRKFRESSWADINIITRHIIPNVSAVSCITNNTFKLYKCCHRVNDKGNLSAVQE